MTSRHRLVACFVVLWWAAAMEGCGNDDSGTMSMGDGADGGPAADGGDDAGSGARDASQDGGADTWSSFAEGFMEDYCVGCHHEEDRDYRTLEHVRRDADSIRCGVAPEALEGCGGGPRAAQFPVGDGPKPSDEERRRLVAWIDAGLPE